MSSTRPIYLDHNASCRKLVDAMSPYLREDFGDPSSFVPARGLDR